MRYSRQPMLVDFLVKEKVLSKEVVNLVRLESGSGDAELEHFIREGVLSEEVVARAIAKYTKMEYVELDDTHSFPIMSHALAEQMRVVPFRWDGSVLHVALCDAFELSLLDTVAKEMGCEVQGYVVTPTGLGSALERFAVECETQGEAPPIVELVHQLFVRADRDRASDIHIEPMESEVRVRYRIDGVLRMGPVFAKVLHAAIVARIKVLSETMSLGERRLPQDGRISYQVDGRVLDLRVSCIPSHHGEALVVRILDQVGQRAEFKGLGVSPVQEEAFRSMLTSSEGLILLTGPTGAGKSTTLYSCLRMLNTPGRKLITVEDPVEYELPGVSQAMVRQELGMTFSAVLKAILRQAPNVIMVGEVRDRETASVVVNAALTGHLVLSTLHTNDALGAVTRLQNMGVKSYLIASSLRAVVAQRLVRRLCEECKERVSLSSVDARMLGQEAECLSESFVARGCSQCAHSGYSGRVGVFEVCLVDDALRSRIARGESLDALVKWARSQGMVSLHERGVQMVSQGVTSVEEVISLSVNVD